MAARHADCESQPLLAATANAVEGVGTEHSVVKTDDDRIELRYRLKFIFPALAIGVIKLNSCLLPLATETVF